MVFHHNLRRFKTEEAKAHSLQHAKSKLLARWIYSGCGAAIAEEGDISVDLGNRRHQPIPEIAEFLCEFAISDVTCPFLGWPSVRQGDRFWQPFQVGSYNPQVGLRLHKG